MGNIAVFPYFLFCFFKLVVVLSTFLFLFFGDDGNSILISGYSILGYDLLSLSKKKKKKTGQRIELQTLPSLSARSLKFG